MHFEAFFSFTLAIVILITGKFMTLHSATLRKYAIPEPVVGGILCAAIVALIYPLSGVRISFDLEVKDFLLLLFRRDRAEGRHRHTAQRRAPAVRSSRPCDRFHLHPEFRRDRHGRSFRHGGESGADGRVHLADRRRGDDARLGADIRGEARHRKRPGAWRRREHRRPRLRMCDRRADGGVSHAQAPHCAGREGHLDVGVAYDRQPASKLDYFAVLWAILILNVTVMLGMGINEVLNRGSLTLPAFVSCILAGIAMRNLLPGAIGAGIRRIWPSLDDGFSLLSDLSLGLFLTMALMGLQLWDLKGMLGFIACTLAVQIALAVVYALFVVFRAMGRDYEAVVMSAGFGGIALGSTATAMANMAAVAQRHGPAHRAFIIVPLVCGFFIDIANALIISMFVA